MAQSTPPRHLSEQQALLPSAIRDTFGSALTYQIGTSTPQSQSTKLEASVTRPEIRTLSSNAKWWKMSLGSSCRSNDSCTSTPNSASSTRFLLTCDVSAAPSREIEQQGLVVVGAALYFVDPETSFSIRVPCNRNIEEAEVIGDFAKRRSVSSLM